MIKRKLYRSSALRILITIDVLINAGLSVSEACKGLYERTENKAEKEILKDVVAGLSAGEDLKGFSKYLSNLEYTILSVSYRTNVLKDGINSVLMLAKLKAKALRSIISSLAYPTLLLIAAFALVKYIAGNVLPEIAQQMGGVESLKQNSAVLGIMMTIAQGKTLLFVIAGIILLIVGIFLVIKYVHGDLRKKIDKVFPFSIYRYYSGLTFMFLLIRLMRSGLTIVESLDIIEENGNKYMSTIARDLKRRIQQSDTLGEALENTGWKIPDSNFVNLLVLISDKRGFVNRADEVLKDYLENFEESVGKNIKIFSTLVFLFAGLNVIMLISGVMSVLSQVSTMIK